MRHDQYLLIMPSYVMVRTVFFFFFSLFDEVMVNNNIFIYIFIGIESQMGILL